MLTVSYAQCKTQLQSAYAPIHRSAESAPVTPPTSYSSRIRLVPLKLCSLSLAPRTPPGVVFLILDRLWRNRARIWRQGLCSKGISPPYQILQQPNIKRTWAFTYFFKWTGAILRNMFGTISKDSGCLTCCPVYNIRISRCWSKTRTHWSLCCGKTYDENET